ncbi:ABC transporter ATP-binding protein [Eubacterium sp.]|uniref:ABC transporter ATP-binding protein n=1 Tax=Eubacterium sp. TaxID=142586 RepID=UPI002FCBCE8C
MDIELKDINVAYDGHQVLNHFSAVFPQGAVTGICGPSGVGKTTLLRLLAHLITPDSGEVLGLPGENRIACVFQENRLLPWYDIRQNIAFVLESSEEHSRIEGILKMVGLSDVGDKRPDTLSGGMKKRVALARAFCKSADLLLLDEPFTGLDQALKGQIMEDFLNLWQRDRRTTVLVSHDAVELECLCTNRIDLSVIGSDEADWIKESET